jgi:hypothetical protein
MKNIVTMAPPPLSKIMPTHDEKSCSIGKKILADSWGQCALIRCNGQKKGQMLTQKTYLLFESTPVSGLQDNIQ